MSHTEAHKQDAGVTAHGGRATVHATTDERRRQQRIPLSIKVSYPRRNAFFFEYTRNISHGGMFIGTQKPFPIGTRFKFALEIPGEDEPLQLTGEVRWRVTPEDMEGLKEPVENLETGMGIAFLFEDQEEREVFEAHVATMIQDAFGVEIAQHLLPGG